MPLLPRFTTCMDTLCALIARHGLARGLAGALIVLVCGRVRRQAALVAAVLTRIEHGRLRRHPARRPPRRSTTPRRKPGPRQGPGGRLWLVRLIQETAASGAQLQALVADPEVPALLAAAPQLRRALSPLCHMLGVALPRPPRPEPAPPAAPPADPDPVSDAHSAAAPARCSGPAPAGSAPRAHRPPPHPRPRRTPSRSPPRPAVARHRP